MAQSKDRMDIFEHLGELRIRIIWTLVVLVLSLAGGLFASGPILAYLKSTPPAAGMEWNAFSPWDAINIYLQIAFVLALIIVIPFALFQLWAFVRPGLRKNEQKAALRYVPIGFVLFVGGLSFAYFVIFPMAFRFTLLVTRNLQLTETFGISQYFSFMFNIIVPVSLLFELPVVVMFLTKIRILNPKRLRKMRRVAYLLLIIIATIVTPPDVISDILVAIPLLLLYELSVFMSGRVYRKQLAAEARWAVADDV